MEMKKIRSRNSNVYLRVAGGHFATAHSHINFYIDVTTQKSRLSEAKDVAKELVSHYQSSTIVDTILCLDGTEVIGTCLAEELTNSSFTNLNAHQTIYIITPEIVSGGQMVFRDNLVPMIEGKHVLILAASITTGKSVRSAMDTINYYSGETVGVSAIFASVSKVEGQEIHSIFDTNDLDYSSYSPHLCPFCKRKEKIQALVNSYGYSKL